MFQYILFGLSGNHVRMAIYSLDLETDEVSTILVQFVLHNSMFGSSIYSDVMFIIQKNILSHGSHFGI